MRDSAAVLIALVLALIAGLAIAASGNITLLHAADLVVPVGTLWVNAIRMTVIPLVVSLLITGVASTTELTSIGRIGGRTVLVFVSLLIGTALLAMPAAVAVFSLLPRNLASHPALPPGAQEAAGQLGAAGPPPTFVAWLTSLIPTNPVAAAATGAMLPMIVFTLLLALAITRSSAAARERLVGLFQALRDVMLLLVRWIVALAPIGVFALILPLAAHGGIGVAGGVGFYVVTYSLALIIFTLLLYPAVALVGRVPLARFTRAALPAQLIAFSTSSSIASLPAQVEGADRELKLDDKVSGFVLPVAASMFKVAAPVSWTIGALFVAWFYGIELHTRELATVAFAAVFLAFTAPGVPRGAWILLAPLFSAIGLPVEGIGILIAVDAIPDLFSSVLNATGDLAAAVLVARFETTSS
jgi:proton glutamate symport protein